jgi:Protein of unknown function (DUF3717)
MGWARYCAKRRSRLAAVQVRSDSLILSYKPSTSLHARQPAASRREANYTGPDMPDISIHELEAAINFWRARSPSSGDELSLCKEASALSRPYALLIVQRQLTMPPERLDPLSRDAWETYVKLRDELSR